LADPAGAPSAGASAPPPPAVPGAPAIDANDHVGLHLPSWGRLARHVGRALLLRCPACGGGPVLRHWFRLHDACGTCGVPLHRGESDYYLGAIAVNLAVAEGLFAVGLVTVMLATWPDVPWDALEIWAPVGMLVLPALTYPVTKLLWLAVDLAMRPAGGAAAR